MAPAQPTSKLWRAFSARKDVVARYVQWSAGKRDDRRALLWMHAPSVGEGLMALPVIQQVRAELSDVQIVYTYFSPSAEKFARTLDVDFSGYLPFDSSTSAKRILQAIKPTALVFSKLDVWPVLVEHARGRGVKLGLISASMSSDSSRSHGIGAALTRDAYRSLDRVGAASKDDANLLIQAGVRADRIQITGDTRYDQAWTRARMSPRNAAVINTLRNSAAIGAPLGAPQRFTLVAGSTWPADEAVLFPAWEQLRVANPSAKLIIAPHEILDAHLRGIERWAERTNLTHKRLSDSGVSAADVDVIIVDRMGILADLYKLATVAYVGGGFHSHGLHSVVEPAVFHVPTLIGPRSQGSRDAQIMQKNGGLLVVKDVGEMAARLIRLSTNEAERSQMQQRLAATISGELGATQRSFEIVRQLLGAV